MDTLDQNLALVISHQMQVESEKFAKRLAEGVVDFDIIDKIEELEAAFFDLGGGHEGA